MKQLAPGVHHINCMRIPNSINAFLLEDVLVDAGGRGHAKRIMGELKGHRVSAHALTHAHADHQGSSHEICTTLGIPYWVPELDVPVAENPELIREGMPDHPMPKLMVKMFAGPAHPVDRALKEGDEVAGFKVLFTPGHSLGHVAFWRESDRVLVLGDVLNNQDPLLGIPGLRLPKDYFTADPETNRQSAKKLGQLEPKLVLFGHGGRLRDTKKFVEFCAAL